MDLGTIIGVVLGVVLMVWAIMAGGSAGAYWDTPSVVLVVGGSIAALLISVPLSKVKELMRVMRKTMFHKAASPQKLIDDLVSYAEIARRDGILSLENHCKDIDDPFIVRGIQMAVDGTDPELIEQILSTELENLADRHSEGKSILDTLGRYAPAFGKAEQASAAAAFYKWQNYKYFFADRFQRPLQR